MSGTNDAGNARGIGAASGTLLDEIFRAAAEVREARTSPWARFAPHGREGASCRVGVEGVAAANDVDALVVSARRDLRALFERARDVMALLDGAGEVSLGNAAMAEAFMCPIEHIEGRALAEFVAPGDRGRLVGACEAAMRGDVSQIEVSLACMGGKEHRVLALSLSPVCHASNAAFGLLAVGRDVTAQWTRDAQFVRLEELAAVGQAAACAAHEMNNPLTAIMLCAEQLGHSVERSANRDDALRVACVSEAARRIHDLVRGMLARAPSAADRPAAVSLSWVTARAGQLCEPVLRERGANLDLRVTPDTPQVWGLRRDLTQVFVNLITNACHATPRGAGRVVVEVEAVEPRVVRAVVSDNGHGIAREDLPHVFEPFYSTKAEGEGTGLGLTIVRDVLRIHRATWRIESAPGAGTRFTIDFPPCSA